MQGKGKSRRRGACGAWWMMVAEYRCLPKCLGQARTLMIVAAPTSSMFRIQASAPKPCTVTFPNLFDSLPGPSFTVVRSSLHHVITSLHETIHTCQTSPRSTTPTAPDPWPGKRAAAVLAKWRHPTPRSSRYSLCVLRDRRNSFVDPCFGLRHRRSSVIRLIALNK